MNPPPVADLDLERRSVRGGALVVGARGLQLVVFVGATIVLARLLTPRDFGLVAMASVVTGAVLSFKDFGFPLAVVQQDEIGDAELGALFWLNLWLTALLTVATAATGPLLAWFFDEPHLLAITLAGALGVFVSGLPNIHSGLLLRAMRFRVLSQAELISAIVGAVAGIASALLGTGFWALVVQQLAALVVRSAVVWSACDWRPPAARRARHRAADTRSLLAYSRRSTYGRILNEMADQLDRILVGRFAGAAQLGLYQMGHRWSTLPALQLLVPLKNVAVASFSRVRSDPQRYRAQARAAFSAVLAPTLPILSFLIVSPEDVVLLLVGDQWLGAAPVLRTLALASFAGCAGRLTSWLYLSEGRTGPQLRWTLVSRPLVMLGIACGSPWGAIGVATGYAVAQALLAWPGVYFCLLDSPLSQRDFGSAIWRPAAAATVAAVSLLALRATLALPDALVARLAVEAVLFSAVYVGFWLAAPGGARSARSLWALLRT